jgi:hypothetical protein
VAQIVRAKPVEADSSRGAVEDAPSKVRVSQGAALGGREHQIARAPVSNVLG